MHPTLPDGTLPEGNEPTPEKTGGSSLGNAWARAKEGVAEALERIRLAPTFRIYLYHHFPRKAGSEEIYETISAIPDEKKRQHFQMITDTMFSNPKKVVLGYFDDADTETSKRLKTTVGFLSQRYSDVKVEKIKLPYPKELSRGKKIIITTEAMDEAIRTLLQSMKDSGSDTAVIVANRSHVPAFNELVENHDVAHSDGVKRFQEKNYAFADYYRNGNPYRYNPHTGFIVTPENFETLRTLVGSEKAFDNIAATTGILEFQNQIAQAANGSRGHVFIKTFLIHPKSPEDLRVFCLAKLFKNYWYENEKILQSCFSDFKKRGMAFSDKMLKLVFQHREISEAARDAIVTSLLYAEEREGEGKIFSFFEPYGNDATNDATYAHCKKLAKALRLSHSGAESILENSLDELIKGLTLDGNRGENRNVIPRTFHRFQKRSESEIRELENAWRTLPEEEKYDEIPVDVPFILNSQRNSFVLLGSVWEGKSTELAIMKGRADADPSCLSLFYSAKTTRAPIIKTISSDLALAQTMLASKTIVVFFDGIDELDEKTREDVVAFLMKTCDNPKIRTIMGSRLSNFDKYSDWQLISIHFDPLDEEAKNDFFASRLRASGVPGWDLENKFQQISDFLSNGMLNESLKNTPLILFFLCKLCTKVKDGKTLSDTIRNRTDLYEQIVGLLLTEHQWRKSELEWNRWNVRLLLDTLSHCAFKKWKGQVVSRQEIASYLRTAVSEVPQFADTDQVVHAMVDQIFLLYKLEGGEYQFILKSFEEYFLARYLFEQPKGVTELYAAQEKGRQGNWGVWRSLQPVILFYGEMLGNKWKTRALNAFLGKNGLLKNDDIFGEGFFTGLKILHGIPEEIAKNRRKRGSGLLVRYLEKIRNWSDLEVIQKLEKIEFLSQSIRHNGEETLHEIVSVLQKHYFGNQISMMAKVRTEETVGEIISQAETFIDSWKFQEALEIYAEFVKHDDPEMVKAAAIGAEAFIKAGRFSEAWAVYRELAKKSNREAEKIAIDGAEKLVKFWKFRSGTMDTELAKACGIYSEMAKNPHPRAAKAAALGAESLIRDGWSSEAFRIYMEFARSSMNDTVKMAARGGGIFLKEGKFSWAATVYAELAKNRDILIAHSGPLLLGARTLTEAWEPWLAAEIYSALARRSDYGVVEATVQDMKKFLRAGNFPEAGAICRAFAKNRHPSAIEGAFSGARALMEAGKHSLAAAIYAEFAKSGDPYIVRYEVSRWADALKKAGEHSLAITVYSELAKGKNWNWAAMTGWPWFSEFEGSWSVYAELAQNPDIGAVKAAVLGARNLLKIRKFAEAWRVYAELAKSGDSEIIKEVVRGVETILRDGGIWDGAEIIYEKLAKNPSDEAVTAAISGAESFIRSGEIFWAASIFSELAKNKNPNAVEAAIRTVRQMPTHVKRIVCIKLAKSKDPSAVREAVYAVDELMGIKDFSGAGSICLELAKNSDSEGIRWALRWAKKLVEEGSSDLAKMIYGELAKNGNSEAAKGVVWWIQNLKRLAEDTIWAASIYRELTRLPIHVSPLESSWDY